MAETFGYPFRCLGYCHPDSGTSRDSGSDPSHRPCSPDLGKPETGGAQQWATGRVLGNGPINLAINVREGDTSNQNAGTAAGLVDADTDEIHIVIRSHGDPIPGLVDEQIHTLTGGCAINGCSNVAVAVFR